MSNKKLFEEAIVDAKAVREAALLNAKEALEEALTPSIQNMLVAKLNEMDMDDEYMEEEQMEGQIDEKDYMQPHDTADEMGQMGYGNKEQGKPGHGDTGLEEEFDLSAILAELEAEEANENLAEAKKGEEDEEEEETEEEMEVGDMSVTDLKNLIKDIVSQELEAEEMETPADEEAEMDMDMDMDAEMGDEEMEMTDEEEIDLEELLAELDSMDGNINEYAETQPDEMLRAICNDYPQHASCKGLKEARKIQKIKSKPVMTNKDKGEMKEAINVINVLRKELNETNLLNAKLLYVNKIFKSKNLSESQKLNVITSFDKATTPKEAKMVYESLEANLSAVKKKSPIKESLGFASKAAGMAPKKQIVESNDVISRMQKLANIIK